MQFTLLEKLGATLLLVLTLLGAEQAYEHHIYQKGVAAESARRDKIDKAKEAAADKELARLAGLLAEAKATLAAAHADLEIQKKELTNVQTRNADLQSDLAAGRRRLLVLTRRAGREAADAQGATPGQVDNGSAGTAELDGQVAANLVGLTGEGDAAIRRLNACIVAYGALEKAVNTAGEHTTDQEK